MIIVPRERRINIYIEAGDRVYTLRRCPPSERVRATVREDLSLAKYRIRAVGIRYAG